LFYSMKMWLVLWCILVVEKGIAQNEVYTDPISSGQGNTSVSNINEWSAINNPAQLGKLKRSHLAGSYTNLYLLKALSQRVLVANWHAKKDSSGIGSFVSDFGYALYKRRTIGVSYGRVLSETFLAGVQLGLYQLQFGEKYGTALYPFVTIGCTAIISPEISVSTCIRNLGMASITKNETIVPLPRQQLGIRYTTSNKVSVFGEIDKMVTTSLQLKLGVCYQFTSAFAFRFGIQDQPDRFSFGIGVFLNPFQINIAYPFTPALGQQPAISLTYAFTKPSN
jgi:hypothetical protein